MHKQCEKKPFTEYWVRSQSAVMSYVMSMTHHFHDAEDITQRVAITAAEKFDEYDPERPFIKWVLGIAHFKVLQNLEQRGRDKHQFGPEAHERLARVYYEMSSELPRYRDALAYCLNRLTPRSQKLLSMRYLHELGIKRISDRLSVSNDAVSSKLRRIRATLRQCIERTLNAEARRYG